MSKKKAKIPAGAVTIHTCTAPPGTNVVPTRTVKVTAIKELKKTAPLRFRNLVHGSSVSGVMVLGIFLRNMNSRIG